jgi:UDP-glucose 4-epimerase
MKVLLTGASSFTGLWIAESLAAAGHKVTAALHRPITAYEGLRGERVARLAACAERIEACSFGGDAFLDLITERSFDLLCHHAAQVANYKSPDFDIAGAVHDNTYRLPDILMRMSGLRGVVLTGTVFEANEGGGAQPRAAFTPYGESKTLTSAAFAGECAKRGVPLTRFIIPYPFGPYEEPRFCHYLMSCWAKNEPAKIASPDYVRDNIPVSLLALAYADAATRILGGDPVARVAPSGYVETQGHFARRLSREMAARLGRDCPVIFMQQTEFPEPRICINDGAVDAGHLGWDEDASWAELAAWYRARYFPSH